jgi:energy-coupling factor transporter ATP-binding protein EcfA2
MWVKTLPIWEKKIAAKIIEKKPITEEFLDEVYKTFKIEMKLESGKVYDLDIVPVFVDEAHVSAVSWQGVGNLHGVNRLKPDAYLEVSNGLTVVYGENGSGKSGYTRLLNNAFVSRGDLEILPNVFADKRENISAHFHFEVDGNSVKYEFPQNKDEYAFKTIRVFDSKSASDDMNKESTIDFAPSELGFFDALLLACESIQSRLDAEKKARKIENQLVKYFPNEGKALNAMRDLSAKTKTSELELAFAITEEEKELYERIKIERASLVSLDINKQISVMNQVVGFLQKAERKYSLFENNMSKDKVELYNRQLDLMRKNKLAYDTYGLNYFSEDGIELLGTERWYNFIHSSKEYFDGISAHDKCPLCGQSINEKNLIFKYWKVLESNADANLKVSQEAIHKLKNELLQEDLTFLVESSIQEQWLLENFKEETNQISSAFEDANLIRNQVLSDLENERDVVIEKAISKPDIQGLIGKIRDKEKALNQEQVNNRINECTCFVNEYDDKAKVIELMPIISSYIDSLKWDSLAEKSKIKRGVITNKQKELFIKYVTEDYIATFEDECKKLRADLEIKIVSRGSNAQTMKKLQIKGTSPGKVLSEGEQRAIAIASFLTEAQMDSRNVGIVLDDPICSLDHKRRTYVAKRLIEEAQKRQVIVFTHEITFFMELKTEAEKNNVAFMQETIRNICGEPGDISPVIPWQGMSVKERIKKLKSELTRIEEFYNTGLQDKYYYAAKEWCELLRESWERTVEEILFNDAIQRYNPCVQTIRLRRASFTQDLYMELEKAMTECSAWCHDQARAINSEIPTINDLKEYIACLEKYYQDNRPK